MERAFGYSRVLATGAPAPLCTITVYNAGTLVAATIYSDNLLTAKANPFTPDSGGYFFFYAASGRYDVAFSGTGIATPYTWGDLVLSDSGLSLNGLTASAQLLAVGTAGADFAIVSAGSTHTFNLPDAGAGARGAVTTGAQSFAGAKTFNTPIAAGSGGTGFNGAAAANGQLPIGNGAGFALGSIGGTANQVNVTTGAGTIALSLPQSINAGAAPTFAGLTLTGLADRSLPYSNAGVLTAVGPLTNGQLLIGSTGAAPVAASLTAGTGISITPGAGSVSIACTLLPITTLNGATVQTQTFATGTAGTDFTISTDAPSGTHTFNIPDASAANRGLVTTGAQAFAGAKTFNAAAVFGSTATFNTTSTFTGVATFTAQPIGAVAFGRSTSDLTKNADTTLSNVTGCSFAIGANQTWVFQFILAATGNNTAKYKFAITFPAATSGVRYGAGAFLSQGAATSTSTAGASVTVNANAIVDELVLIQGIVRNGANAGTVQLQFGQSVSDVSNSIIRTDSCVIAHRVA